MITKTCDACGRLKETDDMWVIDTDLIYCDDCLTDGNNRNIHYDG